VQLNACTAEALGADRRDPRKSGMPHALPAGLLEKYDGACGMPWRLTTPAPARVDKYQGVPPYRETIGLRRQNRQGFEEGRRRVRSKPLL